MTFRRQCGGGGATAARLLRSPRHHPLAEPPKLLGDTPGRRQRQRLMT